MGDHGDRWPADVVFFRGDVAPESQVHAERAEEAGGDLYAIDMLGLAGAGEIKALVLESREPRERAGTALPVEEVGIGKVGDKLEGSIVEEDCDDAVRVAIGQRRRQGRAKR